MRQPHHSVSPQSHIARRIMESFIRYTIPSLFLAVIGISAITELLSIELPALYARDEQWLWIGVPLANGLLVYAIIAVIQFVRYRHTTTPVGLHPLLAHLAPALVCSALVPFVILESWLLLGLNLALFLLVWITVKRFSATMVYMLSPERIATWQDIWELSRVYASLITAYTLTNASLEALHQLLNRAPAFGLDLNGGMLLDAMYFSLVVMTTLGFGDIVPHTLDAKILVGLECVSSYIIFALIVGIITRGVYPPHSHHPPE